MQLPPLDRARLLTPLRRVLGCADPEIADWQVEVLQAGLGAHGGVYRVAGHAIAHNQSVAWSLVLKVLCPPDKTEPPGLAAFYAADPATEQDSLFYWQREAHAYSTGLLANLPDGLAAPRCFGVDAPSDDERWLWLDAIIDVSEPQWTIAQFGEAAGCLGRFNGAYLAHHPMPNAPWLSRDWLRRTTERAAPAVARLGQVHTFRVLRRWFRPDVVERLDRLWSAREPLLRALDRLPQTLCHHDAHRFNLMMEQTAASQHHLVAIDWSGVGPGPIGEDAGLLVGIAVANLLIDPQQRDALSDAALAAYLAGLESAGSAADEQQARLGYMATIALKVLISNLPGILWSWMDETWYGDFAQHRGMPIEQHAEAAADATLWLLDRADDALALAGVPR